MLNEKQRLLSNVFSKSWFTTENNKRDCSFDWMGRSGVNLRSKSIAMTWKGTSVSSPAIYFIEQSLLNVIGLALAYTPRY